jgi:uncharacterized protein (TIGR02246 family)
LSRASSPFAKDLGLVLNTYPFEHAVIDEDVCGVSWRKGDAGTIANLWTEEGEFVPADGPAIRGRADIEHAYRKFFQANSPIKAEGKIDTLRFLSRNAAIIEGTTRVWKGTAVQPVTSTWNMLIAREGGQWRVARLSEKPEEVARYKT